MAAYDYLDQSIRATALIESKDIDSFYNPTLNHTGFAWDGTYYLNGVQQTPFVYASWYTEGVNAYRGVLRTFPITGLILLSKVALTILDGSTLALTLWMQFLNQDKYMLADNFNDELNGWTPSGLTYADGILSVICTPDPGNYGPLAGINSNMVINFDFTQDKAYIDVAV